MTGDLNRIGFVLTFAFCCLVYCTICFSGESNNNNDDSTDDLLDNLKRIPAEIGQYSEQVKIIMKASKKNRNNEYVEELKRIVSHDNLQNQKIHFYAMHALWAMGEDSEYFLDKAKSKDRMLAYYAIWILARNPDDKVIEDLRQIRASKPGEDTVVIGAIDTAIHIAFRTKIYKRLESIEDKVAFLLHALLRGNSPFGFAEGDDSAHLHPRAVWAQTNLKSISNSQPDEVAQAILLKLTDFLEEKGQKP